MYMYTYILTRSQIVKSLIRKTLYMIFEIMFFHKIRRKERNLPVSMFVLTLNSNIMSIKSYLEEKHDYYHTQLYIC
mgnify:FL=1